MAKRELSLEDLAKREAAAEQERAARLKEREELAERAAKEVPARFFQLTTDIRDAVRRFNEHADPQRRFTWRESPALAARDPNLGGDFNCGFGRAGAEVVAALVELSRTGRPNAYLMDISGTLKGESFYIRVETLPTGGTINYRVSLDMGRVAWSLEELPERLVRAAATLNYQALSL